MDKTVCLFANIGTGHLNPMLALAAKLTGLGWRVIFYAHANARERARNTGAMWRHYGDEGWDLFSTAKDAARNYLSIEHDVLLDVSIVSSGLPASITMLPYLLDEIRRWRPLFTVHDAAAPWGALAGRLAGVPTVCSMSAFPMNRAQALECYPPGPIQLAAARYLLDRYGMAYDPADTYVNYTDFNLIFSSALWAGDACNGNAAFHFCGPTLAESASEYLRHPAIMRAKQARDQVKKVVYSSFGTVVSGPLASYYSTTIEQIFCDVAQALRERDDVYLILSTGRRPTNTDLPSDLPGGSVSRFDYVPQAQLLEHVDVFVTHAGMNSTNEALWQGTPVVCCPFFGDGPLNARRFTELGAGLTVDYGIATPTQVAAGSRPFSAQDGQLDSVRSALRAVLENSRYRCVATGLQQSIRRERNFDTSIAAMVAWADDRD